MTQNNVIPFGKPIKAVGTPEAERQEEKKSKIDTARAHAVLMATGVGILVTLRYTLFLVLLWIRTPIRLILSLIAIPLVFIIPMMYLGMDPSSKKTMILTWATFAGFGAFTLRWFYDVLLMRLSPEPIFFN